MPQKLPQYDVLKRHYVEDGLSLENIGKLYGASREAVRLALKKAGGVPTRSRKITVDAAKLRELYVDRGLTRDQIAAELGISNPTVSKELKRLRMTRPNRFHYRTRAITRKMLLDLYVKQGKSQVEVAREFGVHPDQIRQLLRSYKIEHRHLDHSRLLKAFVTDAELRRAYVKEGLTIRAMAKRFGFSTTAIAKRLTKLGVPRRRPKAEPLELDRATLKRLYQDERTPAEEIGKMFGRSKHTVIKLLDEYKIPRRTRAKRP